jgi:hypothetical protein
VRCRLGLVHQGDGGERYAGDGDGCPGGDGGAAYLPDETGEDVGASDEGGRDDEEAAGVHVPPRAYGLADEVLLKRAVFGDVGGEEDDEAVAVLGDEPGCVSG